MSTKKSQLVDVPFNRGLRQDLPADAMPLGALLTANNLEFYQQGALLRREGFTAIPTTKYSKSNTYDGPARRTASGANGERIIFTDTNMWLSDLNGVSEAGKSDQTSATRATLKNHFGIGADQAGSVLFADCCWAYGDQDQGEEYLVVAYVQRDALTGNHNTYCDVVSLATGAKLITGQNVGAAGSTVQCRCVSLGSIVYIFSAPSGGGEIDYWKIDFSGGALTQSAIATTLVSNADSTNQFFDVAVNYDSVGPDTGFVLVYRANDGSLHHRATIIRCDDTAAILATYEWMTDLGANWSPSCLAIVGCTGVSGSEKIHAAGYDPATSTIEAVSLDLDLSSPATTSDGSAFATMGDNAQQITIGRVSSTRTVVAVSPVSSVAADDPRGHLWWYAMTDGMVGPSLDAPLKGFANYTIGSKFWRDTSGNVYSVARFNDPSGFQSHFLLLDWSADPDFGTPFPVAHVASGLVPLPADKAYLGIGGAGAGILAANSSTWFAAPVNLGASSLSGQQVGIWEWEMLGKDRFLSTVAQGSLFVGGGTPLVYDGQRLVEMSFYSYPVVGDTAASSTNVGGGGLVVGSDYRYQFVYEWTDATGNRHQSPASPEITVTIGGGDNAVAFSIPCLHATRKQVYKNIPGSPDISDQQAPVRIVGYRTEAGGSIFKRISASGVNNASATTKIAFSDTASDASIATNEILYTGAGGRGELPVTAPPPTLQMTAHDGRLWGFDAEHPERIWCTKTFIDGEMPGYNQGLQIIVSGCGKVNGVAGQDGKLYGLTEQGVYLASYGDGPTNTGQGGFPTPQLLSLDSKCDEPRSVLVAMDGIYFSGPDKWGATLFLIKRGDGTPINIGKRIRNEISAMAAYEGYAGIIAGIVERIDKGRIEVLISDGSNDSSIGYYHSDLVDEEGLGQWTIAKYKDGTALTCIGTWEPRQTVAAALNPPTSLIATTVVADEASNEVLLQAQNSWAADGSGTYSIELATADLRPFGDVGWGTVDNVTFHGYILVNPDVYIEASYDSDFTAPDTATWLSSEILNSTGQPVDLHWEHRTKKLPYASVRYRIKDKIGDSNATVPGILWRGLSIEATSEGGPVRPPAWSMR